MELLAHADLQVVLLDNKALDTLPLRMQLILPMPTCIIQPEPRCQLDFRSSLREGVNGEGRHASGYFDASAHLPSQSGPGGRVIK